MEKLLLKEIKKTNEYKNLPKNINKSKLKKLELLKIINKYNIEKDKNNLEDIKIENIEEEKNLITLNNNNKYLVIEIFSKIENIYKILGDRFRSEAYTNAIRNLRYLDNIPENINELIKIPGIGKGIGEKIIEILKTGELKKLKELENNKIVKSILQLSRIAGIGPVMAKKLHKMKINSIEELRNKVKNNEFKLTNQQELGLKYFEDLNRRIPRIEIENFDKNLQKIVKDIDEELTAEIMGSYIRGKNDSGDIDILLSHKKIKNKNDIDKDYISLLVEKLQNNYINLGTLSHGKFKYMGLYILNKYVRHIDIIFIPTESLVTARAYFIGSHIHNMKMREIAKKLGYRLNEYHLKDNDGNIIPLNNEYELFNILGVEYIEPINR